MNLNISKRKNGRTYLYIEKVTGTPYLGNLEKRLSNL